MKKIFITGGTGYIGSNLIRRLLQEDREVHALVLPDTSLEYIEDCKEKVTFHIYDGSTTSVFDALSQSKPDVVFHLASLFLSEHKSDDITHLIESNVLLGTQLLEAMQKNEVKNLVNTGTSWQHYLNNNYNPVNLYAATKQAFEDILKYYTETGQISAVSLHLFDSYGPGDKRPKFLKLLKDTIDQKNELNMSPGEQLLDLVYIDDIINAFIISRDMLENNTGVLNEVYGISSRKPMKLKEIVKLFGEEYGKHVSVNWGGRPYRNREVMVPWDSYKILPGWKPLIPLTVGLKLYLREEG
jgi:nucleoside-diphosphate-sugar epimerase